MTKNRGGYTSSFLQDDWFPSREEAVKAEMEYLRSSSWPEARDVRVPTFFTHMHTKPKSAITNSVQGPHVIADVGLRASINEMNEDDLHKEYALQMPQPVGKEFGGLIAHEDDQGRWEEGKKDRYQQDLDYNKSMWDWASATHDPPEQGILPEARVGFKRQLLYEAMNLHPYGSYAWNLTGPTEEGQTYLDWFKVHPKKKEWMDGKGEKSYSKPATLVDKGYQPLFKGGPVKGGQALDEWHDVRMHVLSHRGELTAFRKRELASRRAAKRAKKEEDERKRQRQKESALERQHQEGLDRAERSAKRQKR